MSRPPMSRAGLGRVLTPIDRDPARAEEALAWYQNGTLADDDRLWVEARLAAEPALRDQLDFDAETAAALEGLADRVPADIGWAGLQRRIQDDIAATAAATASAAAVATTGSGVQAGPAPLPSPTRRRPVDEGRKGLVASFQAWLTGLMTPQLGAALATLLVIQTVAVGLFLGSQETSPTVDYRSSGDVRPVMMIRVLFDETVTERQLREGLSGQQATIVDGPNALGEYWIATRGDPDRVARALQASGLVASFVIDQRVVPK